MVTYYISAFGNYVTTFYYLIENEGRNLVSTKEGVLSFTQSND